MKKFGSTSRRTEKGSGGVGFINMGTSLLLVVFLVLCLVVFAVLSISTAQADYNLTADQAGQTTEYYAACTKAEEILADIDGLLAEGGAAALDASASQDVPYVLDGEHVSFSVQVNDSQVLDVVLKLTEDGPYYFEIETWQLAEGTEWQGQSSSTLINIGD